METNVNNTEESCGRVWVLSSPDSCLTPYIVALLDERAGDRYFSPSAYAGQVNSGVPGGVTLVVYDNENAEPTDSLEGIDRVVVVGDCGGVADEWRRRGVATVRLNHGWIVGTGMTGVPMALLKAIDRGVYFHVKGADANCAIVHAADLAAAVVALGCGGGDGELMLHDGTTPSLHDFAEALATRLNGKRIYTLSPLQARVAGWFTGTSDLVALSLADPQSFPAPSPSLPAPRDVINYITTHQYTVDDI